ncbi:hypothetical protein HDU76_000110 [Blyttiomyces sp. JEL0837]|nr:hypothetical protein HDU76_000110 [Blyttiomyces sp. JEL0837]
MDCQPPTEQFQWSRWFLPLMQIIAALVNRGALVWLERLARSDGVFGHPQTVEYLNRKMFETYLDAGDVESALEVFFKPVMPGWKYPNTSSTKLKDNVSNRIQASRGKVPPPPHLNLSLVEVQDDAAVDASRMIEDGLVYNRLLVECMNAGRLGEALRIYSIGRAFMAPMNTFVYRSLIVGFARRGRRTMARLFYEDMRKGFFLSEGDNGLGGMGLGDLDDAGVVSPCLWTFTHLIRAEILAEADSGGVGGEGVGFLESGGGGSAQLSPRDEALDRARRVERYYTEMMATGVYPDIIVGTMVMASFAAVGNVDGVKRVKEDLQSLGLKLDIVGYATLVMAYSSGPFANPREAIQEYENLLRVAIMETENKSVVAVDEHGASSQQKPRFKASVPPQAGRVTFSEWESDGQKPTKHLKALTSLLAMLGQMSQVDEVVAWFEEALTRKLVVPDMWTYTTLIAACAKVGNSTGAEYWWRQMKSQGLAADDITLHTLMLSYVNAKEADKAMDVFDLLIEQRGGNFAGQKLGVEDEKDGDLPVVPEMQVPRSSNLVESVRRADPRHRESAEAIERMHHLTNRYLFNTLIRAMSLSSRCVSLGRLQDEMESCGITPDSYTYTAMIDYEAARTGVDGAMAIFQSYVDACRKISWLAPSNPAYTRILVLLGENRYGVRFIEPVISVIREFQNRTVPDGATWSALLFALYRGKAFDAAVELWKNLRYGEETASGGGCFRAPDGDGGGWNGDSGRALTSGSSSGGYKRRKFGLVETGGGGRHVLVSVVDFNRGLLTLLKACADRAVLQDGNGMVGGDGDKVNDRGVIICLDEFERALCDGWSISMQNWVTLFGMIDRVGEDNVDYGRALTEAMVAMMARVISMVGRKMASSAVVVSNTNAPSPNFGLVFENLLEVLEVVIGRAERAGLGESENVERLRAIYEEVTMETKMQRQRDMKENNGAMMDVGWNDASGRVEVM